MKRAKDAHNWWRYQCYGSSGEGGSGRENDDDDAILTESHEIDAIIYIKIFIFAMESLWKCTRVHFDDINIFVHIYVLRNKLSLSRVNGNGFDYATQSLQTERIDTTNIIGIKQ